MRIRIQSDWTGKSRAGPDRTARRQLGQRVRRPPVVCLRRSSWLGRRVQPLGGPFLQGARRASPDLERSSGRCLVTASRCRGPAQVRNPTYAQTLGDLPEALSGRGEEPAQQTALAQLLQPRLPLRRAGSQAVENLGHFATGSPSPRGITARSGPPGGGNCPARILRASLPAPNRAGAGPRSGRASAPPPGPLMPPNPPRSRSAPPSGPRSAPALRRDRHAP